MKASLPVVVALVVALAGCSRPQATGGHDVHRARDIVAASYKAGHGVRLNEQASVFVGLRLGEVVTRDLPGAGAVAAIPRDAILRTVRGSFVFVENGGWLLRSPVATGVDSDGWVEVRDGLYEGDRVVVAGVDAVWLAEISAVNGGVGCADGH